jgi:hypothetical protein
MSSLLTLFGLCGPVSILIALVVLALLSQRLGAVTKRAPLYRWLFVSVALVGVSIVGRLISALTPGGDPAYSGIMLYDVLFVLGLALAVIVAWRYWSWLLHERGTDSNNG